MRSKLWRNLCFSMFLILLFVACNQGLDRRQINIQSDKAKILELHNAQRDYHFGKDAAAFANQLSSDFISVNRGLIHQPQLEETVSRYRNYFSSVEFLMWDDVSEPIVRFSDDGSMAYTVVDKLVRISHQDEYGQNVEGETHFAWTAIYKKVGSEWKIDCVTSTEKAQPESPPPGGSE